MKKLILVLMLAGFGLVVTATAEEFTYKVVGRVYAIWSDAVWIQATNAAGGGMMAGANASTNIRLANEEKLSQVLDAYRADNPVLFDERMNTAGLTLAAPTEAK